VQGGGAQHRRASIGMHFGEGVDSGGASNRGAGNSSRGMRAKGRPLPSACKIASRLLRDLPTGDQVHDLARALSRERVRN